MTEAEMALKPVSVRLLLQPGHARGAGPLHPLDQAGPLVLRPLVRRLPVRDADRRRSAGRRDGLGRHGVPDLLHGRPLRLLLALALLERARASRTSTIHEFGHQYWYGWSAPNEFEESWLDEGLNTDSEYRAMDLAYGPREVDPAARRHRRRLDVHRRTPSYAGLPNLDPIRRFAWAYSSGNSYGINSYPKVGPLHGPAQERPRRRSVRPRAARVLPAVVVPPPVHGGLLRRLRARSGRDLSTYRRNLVEGTARLDWSVVSAQDPRQQRRTRASSTGPEAGSRYEKGRPAAFGARRAGGAEEAGGALRHASSSSATSASGRTRRGRGWSSRTAPSSTACLPAEARWVRLRTTLQVELAWAAVDPDRENAVGLEPPERLEACSGRARARPTRTGQGRRPQVLRAGPPASSRLFTQLLWALA